MRDSIFLSVLRIRDPLLFCPWIRDPKWKKSRSGKRVKHLGSYFRRAYRQLKMFIFLCQFSVADPSPGSDMEKARSGSGICITDPQHCLFKFDYLRVLCRNPTDTSGTVPTDLSNCKILRRSSDSGASACRTAGSDSIPVPASLRRATALRKLE